MSFMETDTFFQDSLIKVSKNSIYLEYFFIILNVFTVTYSMLCQSIYIKKTLMTPNLLVIKTVRMYINFKIKIHNLWAFCIKPRLQIPSPLFKTM